MDCFEARQEFAAFWRRELAPDRRAALTAHLAACPKCDRAFRTFAMSAPVLQSAVEPPRRPAADRPEPADSPAARRPAAMMRASVRRRGRLAVSAAAAALIAASVAAYLSVTAPVGTLSEELSTDPIATLMFGSDLNPQSEDLAG